MRPGLVRWSGLLATLLCCACGGDLASPFSAVVVSWDSAQAKYKLASIRISTLSSLRHLEGTSGTILAGGAARADAALYVKSGATVAGLRGQLVTDPPGPVDLSYNLLNGGLVYPENYASLELLSAYANLERARASFADWGKASGLKLQVAPLYAHTMLLDGQGLSPLADGELYYPPLGAWFLPAPTTKAQLPVQFNLGAVAHGLALQAWQQVVWQGAPVDPAWALPAADPTALASRHIGASMAQGVADFLGAAASKDPDWFGHSLQQSAGTRSLDQLRCGSADMLNALGVADESVPYDAYPLGTVLAFSLWEQLPSPPDDNLLAESAQAVVSALAAIQAAQSGGGGELALAQVLDAVVANWQLDATTDHKDPKADLCNSLRNRFQALGLTTKSLSNCSGVVYVAPVPECTSTP
jgi:hypothetical protein